MASTSNTLSAKKLAEEKLKQAQAKIEHAKGISASRVSSHQPAGNTSSNTATGHLPLPATTANSKLGSHRISTYGSYPQKLAPGTKMVDATHEDRMDLVKKMYHILSLQLLLTAIIAAPVKMIASGGQSFFHSELSPNAHLITRTPPWIETHVGWFSLSIFILLACMLVMAKLGSKLQTSPTNYIALLTLTILMAVVVGFNTALDTWKSLWLCVVLSTVIFFLLSSYAWLAKSYFDFKYGPYVCGGICAILVFAITSCILIFFGEDVTGLELHIYVCDIICVLIFTFYMIFDTQWILDDCIDDGASAVLDLYLDIIRWLSTFLGYFSYKH